jgi:hypothetical protein
MCRRLAELYRAVHEEHSGLSTYTWFCLHCLSWPNLIGVPFVYPDLRSSFEYIFSWEQRRSQSCLWERSIRFMVGVVTTKEADPSRINYNLSCGLALPFVASPLFNKLASMLTVQR